MLCLIRQWDAEKRLVFEDAEVRGKTPNFFRVCQRKSASFYFFEIAGDVKKHCVYETSPGFEACGYHRGAH